MGLFSDNVNELFETGLICIPVGDRKAPLQNAWQLFCDQPPTPEQVERWAADFKHVDRIGLCMGQTSQVVAFDFDYEFDERRSKIDRKQFEKDLKLVESHILRVLPQTPAIKVGKKGWTRFFKWNPQLGAGSNVSADRNGVRLFDFLSWHKQTIIPPSIHSIQDGQPLYYRWVGKPLAECLDDLPEIDLDTVMEIARLFGDPKAMDVNSRHGRLFSWLMRMTVIEKDVSVLTQLLLSKDLELNGQDPKGPYLKDSAHFRNGTPEDNAKRWVERVLGWKSAKADRVPAVGRPQNEVEPDVWNYFFEKSFPILRKDILSEKVMIKRDAKSPWTDLVGIEGVIKSYAGSSGLPRSHAKEQAERFVFERKKLEFLCDFPEWDGIDRLAAFGNSMHSPDFTGHELGEILKHWGSNVFRRIESAEHQNRCLLLKGGQGIGKDTLVKHMLKDFSPYFETATLTGTPKDVYELISRLYVLHIEEFDQTKNLDVAFIKSIITQASAFFRESYGRNPSRKKVAVNFISTANVDDILRDPTGNRRFVVIPVESITWDYPKNQSGQVLAQMISLFKAGQYTELPASIEFKVQKILEQYTPPDTNEFVLEMYKERAANLLTNKNRIYLKYSEVALAISDIAKQCGVSQRRINTVLKSKGYSKKHNGLMHYYCAPQ